jgi:hypothetical protein
MARARGACETFHWSRLRQGAFAHPRLLSSISPYRAGACSPHAGDTSTLTLFNHPRASNSTHSFNLAPQPTRYKKHPEFLQAWLPRIPEPTTTQLQSRHGHLSLKMKAG